MWTGMACASGSNALTHEPSSSAATILGGSESKSSGAFLVPAMFFFVMLRTANELSSSRAVLMWVNSSGMYSATKSESRVR